MAQGGGVCLQLWADFGPTSDEQSEVSVQTKEALKTLAVDLEVSKALR